MPQTILFLASSPDNHAKLRSDIEAREISEGLKRSRMRDDFELKNRFAVRVQDLMRELMELNPHIVHFSGHGAGERGLIFEDDAGFATTNRSADIDDEPNEVGQQVLAGVFRLLSGVTQCVVLNACYSEVQAKVIAQHIPYVIGMRSSVQDKTAIAFATTFYDALGAGHSTEKAFDWAEQRLAVQGLSDADTPVLLRQEAVSAIPQYDVFISYRYTQQDWATTLADNLEAQGYTVFIDTRELYGGQDFVQTIEQALKNSRCAVLLATPEAADSGWVQREYELMVDLVQQQKGFFFIPLVLGEFPDSPFLETVQAVDFKQSTENQYHEGFQRLLCALKQQVPGAAPYFSGKLKLPDKVSVQPAVVTPKQASFVEQVFEHYLEADLPLMILAQDGFNTRHYVHSIKAEAEQRYGTDNVLHVTPPTSLKASDAEYFAQLGQQCRFAQTIGSSIDWYQALAERLEQADNLFLLVSGFESGAAGAQLDLAGSLRSLLDTYSFSFKLVVLGGERLAAMKYAAGDLSFLNQLEELPVPPLCAEDIRLLYLPRYQGLQPDNEVIREVLDFSGQHPRVVEACLRALHQGKRGYQAVVQHGRLPAQLFSRFGQEAELAELCRLFSQEQLGRYHVWPRDEVVRKLYWQNLLRMDEKGQMVWRSDWIRDVGKELFGCKNC